MTKEYKQNHEIMIGLLAEDPKKHFKTIATIYALGAIVPCDESIQQTIDAIRKAEDELLREAKQDKDEIKTIAKSAVIKLEEERTKCLRRIY